jgi:Cu(I)/Ag(I) efflux system membrane protein CusA/SilA
VVARVVAWSGRHPWTVVALGLLAITAGELARRSGPGDVLPELSDPRLSVVVEWMGHPPTDVSSRLTEPLLRAVSGVGGVSTVRGISMTGMSYLDVILETGAEGQEVRKEVAGRLAGLRPSLPPEARVQVGPVASSTGWVFQYALYDPTHAESRRSLRQLQQTVLAPALAVLPGVAEVATVGGETEEMVIDVATERLRARGLSLGEVRAAVEAALAGEGQASLATLRELPVGGVKLRDVADLRVGRAMPTGLADVGGQYPAVGGIVVAARGANVPQVLAAVHRTLEQLRARLPPGVILVVVHDRSEVIERIQKTLGRALLEEVGVLTLVVLAFLLSPRAAAVPLLTLPAVVLLTLAAMRVLGIPATLMSVGGIGIALGLAVDAEVVALEACQRRLEHLAPSAPDAERRAALLAATGSFAPAILISLLIAAVSFLPVFGFEGETGRLLRPLAASKTLVILAAAAVALTLAPALRDRLLRPPVVPEFSNPLTAGLVRLYRPFVQVALARPGWTLAIAGAALLSCLPLLPRLGREFLPRIDEGDLLFMPTTLPGAPEEELPLQLRFQDTALAASPAVATVFGKMGRADTATDPAPLTMAETTVRLRPRAGWPHIAHPRWYSSWAPAVLRPVLGVLWPEERPMNGAELVAELDREARLAGWTSAWTAPVRGRLDMVSTGIRTPVGLRIGAATPERLEALGASAEPVLSRIEGVRGATLESPAREPWPTFVADPAKLRAWGVAPREARATADLLTSGGSVGTLGGAGGRIGVRLVQDRGSRDVQAQLREATVPGTSAGRAAAIPLGLVGRPVVRELPGTLRTEEHGLAAYLLVDLEAGTDLSAFVQRADRALALAREQGTLALRPGERLDWIGEYPLLVAGERRLLWIAPLVLLTMVALLYLQFRSLAEVCIVLASVPFALVGSIWTLHWLGYPLSPPVWVGLLSVTGLAMQTGVVMVVYIDDAFRRRLAEGRLRTREDVVEAHAEGTIRRLRPKLMTVCTMGAGLLPLIWADGAGAEILRRIAAPMLGGLLTSTFLTLEVLPVLYTLWRVSQLRRAARSGLTPEVFYSRTGAATEGTPLVSTRKSM